MAKTIAAIQDRILGEFDRTIRQGQTEDVISRNVESSREKRQIFDAKIKDNTICSGGLNVSTTEKGKTHLQNIIDSKWVAISNSIQNKNRHTVLNTTLDIFGDEFFKVLEVDSPMLEEFRNTKHLLIEDSTIKLELHIDKQLSSSLRCFLNIIYKKPIWVKSADYDTTGNTERSISEIPERIKFTAKFGDTLEFRRTLLRPISEVITRFAIQDSKNVESNIWDL